MQPSCVIAAKQFHRFLETIQWIEPFFSDLPDSSLRLNLDNAQQLQTIARQIRHGIQQTPLPSAWMLELSEALDASTLLLMRPSIYVKPSTAKAAQKSDSATLSDALSSLIEAQVCRCDPDSLEISLKQLWAELFRARNLMYWQRVGIALHEIQFAVLMQPLLSVQASGSMQVDKTGGEISAVRGLEFAIARGEAVPAQYRIADHTAIQLQPGYQTIVYHTSAQALQRSPVSVVQTDSVLTDSALNKLIELGDTLRQAVSPPFSVEWQLDDADRIVLTQFRPQADAIVASSDSEALVCGLAASSGQAIAPAYVIDESHRPEEMPVGAVLVTSIVLPTWLPWIKQASAIVAEQGGLTSHSAILARELGIPAIVNAHHATERIQTGVPILVDGDTGLVQKAPLIELATPITMLNVKDTAIAAINYSEATATALMVNLSQPELVDQAAALSIDGVGLVRSELMVLSIFDQQHPQRWIEQNQPAQFVDRLASVIEKLAVAFAPRPVFYRSLDLRSPEFKTDSTGVEQNPMLGLRGTFRYWLDSTLFDLELRALKSAIAAGSSNLRLVLPFVRTVEEFQFCRCRIEQLGLAGQIPVWIMAEVPSVLFLLPEYVRSGVAGICIGTSDLTQLMLGVDRDQGALAQTFRETHPAVMSAIVQLIQSAQTLGIGCSISTQATIEPAFIDPLIEAGISAISVNLNAIETARRAVLRSEQRLLLKHARIPH